MPDDELRRAADRGSLRQPKVLAAQVQRMLRDPKSRALAEHFGGQWLQFRALESVTRDRDRFPGEPIGGDHEGVGLRGEPEPDRTMPVVGREVDRGVGERRVRAADRRNVPPSERAGGRPELLDP
jgi:hypothetical protein